MSIVKFKNFTYLKGPKGDKGDKGDPGQGINGTTGRATYNATTGIIGFDSTGLATESYVNTAVENVTVDLTGYATESYVDTAITASITSNSLASESYVDTAVSSAVSSLVDNAPGLLDTLNEIAQAIGDDPSFITTINASIDSKLSITGGTLTGSLILAADPIDNLAAATKQYVDSEISAVNIGLDSLTSEDLNWNVYNTTANLPSAVSKHGMFAHVHSEGRGYMAHAGQWTALANLTDLPTSTDEITEGTNLYYTDSRSRLAISVTGAGSYDNTTGVITVTGGVTSVNTQTGDVVLSTTEITEGTNLYYTDSRSRNAISVEGDLSYDSITGVISYIMPPVVVDLTGDFDGGDYTELPEYGNSQIIIGGGTYDITPILPVFDSVGERDAAFPTPAVGTMVLTSGSVEVYNGTTWLVLTAAQDAGGF